MGDGRVTFETKCWQGDWEVLLKTDYLKRMIENCDYPFDKRRLLINNVDNISMVREYAKRAVDNGIIDEYIVVDEYADIVLGKYHLSKEELRKGYYYSIAELVGIHCCDTEYLVHFSSDTYLERVWKYNFIRDGLKIFQNNKSVAVVNPLWNYSKERYDNWDSTRTFHLGNGFSDQCYMIRAKEFDKDIYHFWHESGKDYPAYGGNSSRSAAMRICG